MGRVNKMIHETVERNFDEQLRRTREMVRIKSLLCEEKATEDNPLGADLSAALDTFLSIAQEMGFKTKNMGGYVGYVEMGSADAPLIGILAHLDVVPEGAAEHWKYPPYAAAIADDCLYGRGAVDDKGPAVAALFAMAALRGSMPLHRRFRLILGLDEENDSRCIKYYKEHEEIPRYSFSPDAYFPAVNAEKGILRVVVTIKGERRAAAGGGAELLSLQGGDKFNVVPDGAKAEILDNGELITLWTSGRAAHAMEPYKGDNAVQKMLLKLLTVPLRKEDHKLIETAAAIAGDDWSGSSLSVKCSDDISGELTCNCAAAEGRVKDGAAEILLKFDIRYPVTVLADKIISNIEATAARFGASMKTATHKPPLYVPAESYLVQTLLDAYEEVTGERPEPISMGGGTYCRFLPNSVSFGPVFPGEEEVAHRPNERISLDNLRKCTHIYAKALMKLNKAD